MNPISRKMEIKQHFLDQSRNFFCWKQITFTSSQTFKHPRIDSWSLVPEGKIFGDEDIIIVNSQYPYCF